MWAMPDSAAPHHAAIRSEEGFARSPRISHKEVRRPTSNVAAGARHAVAMARTFAALCLADPGQILGTDPALCLCGRTKPYVVGICSLTCDPWSISSRSHRIRCFDGRLEWRQEAPASR